MLFPRRPVVEDRQLVDPTVGGDVRRQLSDGLGPSNRVIRGGVVLLRAKLETNTIRVWRWSGIRSSGDTIRNYRFEALFGPGFCRRNTRPSCFSSRC
jgi:hypothetical protein